MSLLLFEFDARESVFSSILGAQKSVNVPVGILAAAQTIHR
jgi:hypothetical protein